MPRTHTINTTNPIDTIESHSVRKIVHVDMDCFYAAIEIRDKPALAGQPVAIGSSSGRGVVSTCNYIARKYGVRSAMSSLEAKRLCPHLVFVGHNFDKYKEASRTIHEIFHRYTDRVEPLSLDEAFLDVSESHHHQGSAQRIAYAIRQDIVQAIGITASAGISSNKFVAKIASDWNKPNGQYCVLPGQIAAFIEPLPISKIFGVGKKTQKRLNDMGLYSCGDLKTLSLDTLCSQFGSLGLSLFKLCRGEDNRAVVSRSDRKSLSVERTFDFDLENIPACQNELTRLLDELKLRLTRHWQQYRIEKIMIKARFNDFSATTVERRADIVTDAAYTSLLEAAFKRKNRPVRLLGIGVKMQPKTLKHRQLILPFNETGVRG